MEMTNSFIQCFVTFTLISFDSLSQSDKWPETVPAYAHVKCHLEVGRLGGSESTIIYRSGLVQQFIKIDPISSNFTA